jgi:hypothetical protein
MEKWRLWLTELCHRLTSDKTMENEIVLPAAQTITYSKNRKKVTKEILVSTPFPIPLRTDVTTEYVLLVLTALLYSIFYDAYMSSLRTIVRSEGEKKGQK